MSKEIVKKKKELELKWYVKDIAHRYFQNGNRNADTEESN